MKPRSIVEITEEINKLRKMKPSVRRTSMFGDNHHDAIDAQIDILSGDVEENDIHDEYEADNVQDAAQAAADWMTGYIDDVPSEKWESLC